MAQDKIERLKSTDAFKEFKEQFPESKLVHVFHLPKEDVWQVGYYDSDDGRVHTFEVGEEIQRNPADKPFQEEAKDIARLDIDAVDITFKEALEKAGDVQKERYPSELPMKRIVVLQHLDQGQIYNITFVTQTFKTLNIKIDAKTGEVKDESLAPLISFDK